MDDYISRDAFKRRYLCCGYLPEMPEMEFDEFPAADVAPVVHGRWMHEEMKGGCHIWRCSRCGRGTNYNPEGIDLYCYHCGAKMEVDNG